MDPNQMFYAALRSVAKRMCKEHTRSHRPWVVTPTRVVGQPNIVLDTERRSNEKAATAMAAS
jgi:hypothetical protein